MAESQANSRAALPVFQICNGTFSFVSPGMLALCTSPIMHLIPPQNFALALFSTSLGTAAIIHVHKKKKKRKTKVTLAYYRKLTLHEINSNR